MLFFMHIRRTGTKCLSPSNGVAWQRPPSLFLMGDEQNKDGPRFGFNTLPNLDFRGFSTQKKDFASHYAKYE